MKSKKEIEITLKENKGDDFVLPMTWDVMFEQMFISKEAMPLLEHIIAVFGNIDINDVKGKVRLLPNELKQTLAKDTRSKSDIIADYFKDEMIVVRKDSPLVIGKGIEESYISSDIPAILSYTKDFYLLNDNEFALLTRNDINFFDIELKYTYFFDFFPNKLEIDEENLHEYKKFIISI